MPLAEEDVTIGRDESNRLAVADPAASRRHCAIHYSEGRYLLADLDSRNGTFLNDVPVRERALEHRDRLRVGSSVFVFLLTPEEEEELPSALVHLEAAAELETRSTTQLRMEDSLYLHPERVAPSAQLARNLGALLRISTSIQAADSLDALERKLVESVFELAPAERAALLVAGESGFERTFGLNRTRDGREPVRVDSSAASRALREGLAIVSGTAMAVPLVCFGKVEGVLYLESGGTFTEDDLQLLAALGSIGGMALAAVRRLAALQDQNQRLESLQPIEHDMIGESPALRAVHRFIAKVAPADSTVLICGESGTGKELVARAIHRNSRRASQHFVAVNCATLTEPLLEDELFGHEKGAFTGAVAQKKGKFELADGGTLFLDEIGELAPGLQSKLLRVLQEREFERVGGTRPIKVDVRLIAATNRDLAGAVKQGAFRQDLYFRVAVIAVKLPPLRERKEDIPLLASYFISKYGRRTTRKIRGISAEARAWLLQHDWPGNVRELENTIERALVMGATDTILPEDLPEDVLEAEPPKAAGVARYHEALLEAKRKLVEQALAQARGVYTEAARLLGVHPVYLHRLMAKLNLKAKKKGR